VFRTFRRKVWAALFRAASRRVSFAEIVEVFDRHWYGYLAVRVQQIAESDLGVQFAMKVVTDDEPYWSEHEIRDTSRELPDRR
jgi:hypothetical protein